MNPILQQRIEEVAFQESSMYDTIQEKNAAYNTGMKIANFALQNQWISVEEALPKFNGNFSDYYIIRTENGFCAVTMYYRTSEKEYWWNFEKVKVTHWMQIPSLEGGEE